MAEWMDLTEQPLLDAPTVGVRPERVKANTDVTLEVFGSD